MSTAVHLFDLTAHTVMAGVGRMEDMVVQVRDRRTPLEVEQPREPVRFPRLFILLGSYHHHLRAQSLLTLLRRLRLSLLPVAIYDTKEGPASIPPRHAHVSRLLPKLCFVCTSRTKPELLQDV